MAAITELVDRLGVITLLGTDQKLVVACRWKSRQDAITQRALESTLRDWCGPESQANVHAVLQLCASGKLRCSEKTRRPTAVTVTAVGEALAAGDFLPHDAIAAFAWPLLIHAGGLAEQPGTGCS